MLGIMPVQVGTPLKNNQALLENIRQGSEHLQAANDLA